MDNDEGLRPHVEGVVCGRFPRVAAGLPGDEGLRPYVEGVVCGRLLRVAAGLPGGELESEW